LRGATEVNAIDLSNTKPSPEGEGWVTTARMQEVEQRKEQLPKGRESKIRKKNLFNPLIPTFSLREKGLARLSQQHWRLKSPHIGNFFV
jgi:hypothetical protein